MPINPNDPRAAAAFGAPIPGQSLTHAPKNMPWEQPPQFTKLSDAMNFMMDQLTEPEHLKPLMDMFHGRMPIEAIARTLLFAGFTSGKWTVDLAILMYKPLMLSLIALAHRAGMKDIPVLMPKAVNQKKNEDLKRFMLTNAAHLQAQNDQAPTASAPPVAQPAMGFMRRP